MLMMAEQAGDQEDVVTIAEQLREEGKRRGIRQGMQQGIQQGIRLGIQEGEYSASLKIARQLIANGVDRALVKLSTGLSNHELKALIP